VAKVGRPSKFDAIKCEQAEKLCKLGATDKELADFFSVAEATINEWKRNFPEFSASLTRGKAIADAEVASKLYHRAIGYEHPEVHVSNYQGEITLTPLTKFYPPDTTACIFWLKNRRKDVWRDTHAVTGPNGGPLEIKDSDDMETARRVAYLLTAATIQKAQDASREADHAQG